MNQSGKGVHYLYVHIIEHNGWYSLKSVLHVKIWLS